MSEGDEMFVKDTEWAQQRISHGEMTFLEVLWENGKVGLDFPYKHTPEYKRMSDLLLVESFTGSRGVNAIRFTDTGAKFALRYFPRAQKENPWWRLTPPDRFVSGQRDVVVAWELLLQFIVKLEFMGLAERRAFLRSVPNIDDEHREHTVAFVNAVFATYDKE
jgi:hypothetical protein